MGWVSGIHKKLIASGSVTLVPVPSYLKIFSRTKKVKKSYVIYIVDISISCLEAKRMANSYHDYRQALTTSKSDFS
jgi:hypothetical protein